MPALRFSAQFSAAVQKNEQKNNTHIHDANDYSMPKAPPTEA